ncbi:MAG: hypothetical protein J1E81_06025 [Eubacterium sp.]|nr:hypothetical protein [Eubacterium sp.]
MTDEEIEKALSYCKDTDCEYCPYTFILGCEDKLREDARGYINRLKEQLYQAEQKLAECENGYQGTLFLERCKHKDELEQVRQDTAKEIVQGVKDILAEMDCSMKSWLAIITKINKLGEKFGVLDD